ncbi:MAG: GNAT family N-acetyltransferase [Bacteroides sp.]|nr:GNAT family N-acetyltransferase [Bacteroides sp.]
MLTLRPITTADTQLYNYMEQLLQTSFPPEEYRPLEELRRFTDEHPAFCNQLLMEGETPVGLLTYWDFSHFCYVEHFAIDPQLRGSGRGAEALTLLADRLSRPLVLEVEMPDTEQAIRRIAFYRRQGFQLWETPYFQPPYRSDDTPLPMQLMVRGALIEASHFAEVCRTIHRQVYSYP